MPFWYLHRLYGKIDVPAGPSVSPRVQVALDERIREQRAARFARGVYNDRAVFGFPLCMSSQLVLIQELPELQDGFVILRCGDISEMSPNRADRQLEALYRQEAADRPTVPALDLRCWRTVCEGLAGSEMVVELVNERNGLLNVGRVVRAGRDSLSLRSLDRLGYWEKRRRPIRYRDITRMHLPVFYSAAAQ